MKLERAIGVVAFAIVLALMALAWLAPESVQMLSYRGIQ